MCPFLSAYTTASERFGYALQHCIGSRCSLFDNQEKCCSQLSTTMHLREVIRLLEELNSYMTNRLDASRDPIRVGESGNANFIVEQDASFRKPGETFCKPSEPDV